MAIDSGKGGHGPGADPSAGGNLIVRGPVPPLELRISSGFATELLHGALTDGLARAHVIGRPVSRFAGVRCSAVTFERNRARVRVEFDLPLVVQWFQRRAIEVEIANLRLAGSSTIHFDVARPLSLGAVPRILSTWKLPKPLANLIRQLTTAGTTVTLRLPELARESHSFLVRHILERYQLSELSCESGELHLKTTRSAAQG